MYLKRRWSKITPQELQEIFKTLKAWYTPGMRRGKMTIHEKYCVRDLHDAFKDHAIDGFTQFSCATNCWTVDPEWLPDIEGVRRYMWYKMRYGERGYAGILQPRCGNDRCCNPWHQLKRKYYHAK